MYVRNRMGQRLGRIDARAQTLKAAPSSTCNQAKLLCNVARQRTFSQRIEYSLGVTRILQDFRHVRQWLVQCAASCSGWLDTGTRTAPPRNQAFGLQRTQCLTHGKPRHSITLAQVALGWKSLCFISSAENFLPQFFGKFLITRLYGQIFSPRSAAFMR